MDEDQSLALPVCEAIDRLPLTKHERRGAVDAMLERLGGVAAADVAAVALFVLRECTAGDHALRVVKVRLCDVHRSTVTPSPAVIASLPRTERMRGRSA